MNLYKCHSCLSVIKIIEFRSSMSLFPVQSQDIYNISRERLVVYIALIDDSMGSSSCEYEIITGFQMGSWTDRWIFDRSECVVRDTIANREIECRGEKINIENPFRKKKGGGGDKYRCDAVTTGNKSSFRKIISTLKNRTQPNRRFDYSRIGFRRELLFFFSLSLSLFTYLIKERNGRDRKFNDIRASAIDRKGIEISI